MLGSDKFDEGWDLYVPSILSMEITNSLVATQAERSGKQNMVLEAVHIVLSLSTGIGTTGS